MAASSPQERIGLVQRGFEAWDAGDVETVLGLLDPEIEVFTVEGLINAGRYRGHHAFLRWAEQWFEAWENFRNTPDKIVAVGDRHAVARVHQVGRGRGSGVEVEMTVGWTFEYRDGRCAYLALHQSFEDAMADAHAREGITTTGGPA